MMAKKKEMNRTSGVAGRKLGRSEAIGFKLKAGMPLTGSASGVKGISLKDAGEVLTQGMVTLGKKGLKVAPEGLAMALPYGKVFKAASALRGAGKIVQATALEGRLLAKNAGSRLAKNLGKGAPKGNLTQFGASTLKAGRAGRTASEGVYPTGNLQRRGVRPEFGPNPMKATPEMQSVANKITQRHYADVTKKGLGHAEAVDMNRAKVLRNLASKRGVDLGVAKASVKRRGGK